MDPLVVEARRAGVAEARHLVHAVAVRDGAVVAEAGDGGLVCFMRSSSKPLQALPLALARPDLDDRELAIACASHRATDAQLDAARALLSRAEATEDDLALGPQEGRPPTRLHHNCSGKHAGMLAVCRARGWPLAGYAEAGHPLQQELLRLHAEAAEAPVAEIVVGVDGCGVSTFALPLERMAHAFSRLELLDGGVRVAAAMRAHPELVGGPGAVDTELMERLPGWLAKSGAEGLLCLRAPDGTGLALKTADGSPRAHRPALAAILARLETELADWVELPLAGAGGRRVGELVSIP